MAIILRFVDCKGFLRERFFKLVSVVDTRSQTLKDEISRILAQFDLNEENMRGQGYDGANSSAKRHSMLKSYREEEILDILAVGTLETGSVMRITEFLSQAFQKKEIDILNAMQFFSMTKGKLQTMRDGGWDSLITKIETFCSKHVNVRYAVIDLQLMELEKRFPETSMELLGLSVSFDPRNGFQAFKAEDVCKLASKFYPCDFTSCDMDNLKMECGFFLGGIEEDSSFYGHNGESIFIDEDHQKQSSE
ncbi:hypothetical protein QQ045_016668 [Rhodiola kirilowii]